MSSWNSPDLVTLIGGPLDSVGLCEESIRRLIEARTPESEQLEFKRELYSPVRGSRSEWNEDQEFAKDVSALANARGGMILVGVEERGGLAQSLVPIGPIESTENEERRLRMVLVNYQAPVAECQFTWVSIGTEGTVLAVIVPPSRRSPHAVLGGPQDLRRTLRYPYRHGADTSWLTETEVARRYQDRFLSRADEAARLAEVASSGIRALRTATGVWLYVAISPENPVSVRLDKSAVERAERWRYEEVFTSPLGRTVVLLGRGIPAPGQVTFTAGPSLDSDGVDVSEAYVSLHMDGAGFAALPVAARTSEDTGRDVGELTLVDDCILLVDELCRWTAHQSGSWGTASIRAGLVDADGDGDLKGGVALVNAHNGTLSRLRGTRVVAGDLSTETVVDLAFVESVQQRLGVCHAVLSGLLQWFGRAEPSQLGVDGRIAVREFPGNWRDVETWATNHGVKTLGPAL